MTTKREQILSALGAGLGIDRNAPIRDFEGAWTSLLDGDIERMEEFLNAPTIYEWQARPVLLIAVEGGTPTQRDAALAALIEDRLAAVSSVAETLLANGLVEEVRPGPPDYEANNLWGAAGVKVAELIIEIDYWSDRPVG